MRVNVCCNLTNGDLVNKKIRVAAIPRKGESIWIEKDNIIGEFDVEGVVHENGEVTIITKQQ